MNNQLLACMKSGCTATLVNLEPPVVLDKSDCWRQRGPRTGHGGIEFTEITFEGDSNYLVLKPVAVKLFSLFTISVVLYKSTCFQVIRTILDLLYAQSATLILSQQLLQTLFVIVFCQQLLSQLLNFVSLLLLDTHQHVLRGPNQVRIGQIHEHNHQHNTISKGL